MAVQTEGKLQKTHRSVSQLPSITVSKLGAIRGGKCEIRVYFALNMQKILYYAELVSALTQSLANYLVVEYIPSSTVSVQTVCIIGYCWMWSPLLQELHYTVSCLENLHGVKSAQVCTYTIYNYLCFCLYPIELILCIRCQAIPHGASWHKSRLEWRSLNGHIHLFYFTGLHHRHDQKGCSCLTSLLINTISILSIMLHLHMMW